MPVLLVLEHEMIRGRFIVEQDVLADRQVVHLVLIDNTDQLDIIPVLL